MDRRIGIGIPFPNITDLNKTKQKTQTQIYGCDVKTMTKKILHDTV